MAAAGNVHEGPVPLGAAILGGDLSTAPPKVDLLIVGAGLSGAVIAERCSRELGMTSLIIDVRDHVSERCEAMPCHANLSSCDCGSRAVGDFPRTDRWQLLRLH